LKTLHVFNGTDGQNPIAALVQATDGNLYGTTTQGGQYGGGTIFRLTLNGTLTTIYNFCSQSSCVDGSLPWGTLLPAIDGNLYGTTRTGGTYGQGTVFKMTLSGTLTTLYSFSDGGTPYAGLIQATDRNFYGTTCYGGARGFGSVFKMTPAGVVTTIASFEPEPSGLNPQTALLQGLDGNFYGTAPGGMYDNGVFYRVTPSGELTTLYNFCSNSWCLEGEGPGAIVRAPDGDFYGATGNGSGYGTGSVFKISSKGNLTVLNFSPPYASFWAALVAGSDGNLYGTSLDLGGTVYRITPAGSVTTLHSFCLTDCSDGYGPYGGLVQATNGNLYGTTWGGGATFLGTVFVITARMGPLVETLPVAGKVGTRVRILGTNLIGASSVTFDGIPAVFSVVSKSSISTNVPIGATTGHVQVVTPAGTLTSNAAFQVLE
jgi:uncharacterized repeat protein (TIGR03803 family)